MRHLGSVLVTILAVMGGTAAWAGPLSIDLGSAANFAVLAGSDVTNTGPSNVTGNLGVWPGTSMTAIPPGMILDGQAYMNDAIAMQAQSDARAAFIAAAAQTGAVSLTGNNLGGMTLTPGLYSFSSSADLTGTLTLNAENTQNAVFVFQIGSTLTIATNALVSLINGQTDTVIWEVGSSATLGAGTRFAGDILASASITFDTGATLSCGGAMALTGAVTMDSNTIAQNGAACGAGGTPVPEPPSILILGAACPLLLAALFRRRGPRASP